MQTATEHKTMNGTGVANESDGSPLQRHLTSVTLTPEQFESLYLQPRNPRMNPAWSTRFGNPTPLGISVFLLALTPLSMDLLQFRGATPASSTIQLGAFYGCAGIGLYLASIMEWVLGNTFPSVVFGTFGGFWISYGIIVQPTLELAASFAPATLADGVTAAAAGAATRPYNSGLALYFLTWGILCMIYFIASLRTNVPFAIIFFTLTFAFLLIASAFFHVGQAQVSLALRELKEAGAFAFVTVLAGFWIDISLILASVGFPIRIPIMDLSTRGLLRTRESKDHIA